MSLKRLTSDVDLYADYLEHLDSLISQHQQCLQSSKQLLQAPVGSRACRKQSDPELQYPPKHLSHHRSQGRLIHFNMQFD